MPVIRINVNSHVVRRNQKTGENNPPIAVRRGRRVEYAHDVRVSEGRFVYSPDKPLSCGARLWFETEGDVKVIR